MKKILSLLLAVLLICTSCIGFSQIKANAASTIYIGVNNEILTNPDMTAQMSNSIFYVPLQVFTDYLGFSSTYDSFSNALSLSYRNKVIYFNRKIGLAVDDDNNYYSYTFYIDNNSFMVPAQFICSYFGLTYSFFTSVPFIRIISTPNSLTNFELYQNYYDFFNPPVTPEPDGNSDEPGLPQPVYNKKVYLTFDNCPNEYTEKILDTLDTQDVKATFFVTTEGIKKYPELIFRMIASGHQIGLNGSSDLTADSSAQEILQDFEQCRDALYKTAKITTFLIRSPFGSYDGLAKESRDLLTAGGFRIWDYNIQSGDAPDKDMSYYVLYANVTNRLKNRSSPAYVIFNSTNNTNNALLQLLYFMNSNDYYTYTLNYMLTPVNQWQDTR